MIKLITTDSYFNIFPVLNAELEGKVNTLSGKNLIFCEEKISLMVERSLMSHFNGSFNTAVYSFGNYLRTKKPLNNVLSKEGSAMAVKRVLSTVSLACFKASRATLAPSLFDLIIQLKSSKVTPEALLNASNRVVGTLKNKLIDVANVYSGYENYLKERGLEDQSSMLSHLSEVILNDKEMQNTDVYIIGFNGFTSQIRSAISALLKRAKSVTAILTEGENEFAYVNETASSFCELVNELNLPIVKDKRESEWSKEGKLIASTLFNPKSNKLSLQDDCKIFTLSAENKAQECEAVAEIIRQKVIDGECKYKDITVAVPDLNLYSGDIERAFRMLDLPFFIDQKKKVGSHALIRLILSYMDAFRKNLEKNALSEFYKNPLFCCDKALSDEFENYVLEFNVDYSGFKKDFTLNDNDKYDLAKLNDFRQSVVNCFTAFNIKNMLVDLDVENKLTEYAKRLADMKEQDESAVCEQIYQKVDRILTEMEGILGDVNLPIIERRSVFLSGVSAMELSIIPQYNDAVFVGGFKEASLAKAKYLFALGLTSDVPQVKEDVALLSDGDIGLLEDIKVLVEPKIKVVNHRARENVALALSAFSDGLYLSCPLVSLSGERLETSSVLKQINKSFNTQAFPSTKGYLSYKQALSAFARDCGEFAKGKLESPARMDSFYELYKDELKELIDRSGREIARVLKSATDVAKTATVSPSRIENYHTCPYKAFLGDTLNIRPRKEGQLDHLSTGNIAHAIFEKYLKEIGSVEDKDSSTKLVESLKNEILADEKYSKFLADEVNSAGVERVASEVDKYCYKNYLALKNSSFKHVESEASFGYGKEGDYLAIELSGGAVKMRGKVDRIDEFNDYFRIIDYKTGRATADLDKLFSGNKLQLYLYAKAISQGKTGADGKTLAGAYYMPIKDDYRVAGTPENKLVLGYTLDDDAVIESLDAGAKNGEGAFLPTGGRGKVKEIKGAVSQEALNAFIDYAVAVSDKAVERMREGFIEPSPTSNKICEYCDYKALCPYDRVIAREIKEVDESVIVQSVNASASADGLAQKETGVSENE